MPADLDQFGCEDSHRAVIGGKSLVKLGHVPANARSFLNQINLETGSGKVQGSLNTTNAAADNHDVTKIFLPNTSRELLNNFFRQYFDSHLLSPYRRFMSVVPGRSG